MTFLGKVMISILNKRIGKGYLNLEFYCKSQVEFNQTTLLISKQLLTAYFENVLYTNFENFACHTNTWILLRAYAALSMQFGKKLSCQYLETNPGGKQEIIHCPLFSLPWTLTRRNIYIKCKYKVILRW